MARLFGADSDSDESNNLPDIDCLDCARADDVVSGGHVHPVTLIGRSYAYQSPLSDLTIHIEHRPEKGLSFQIWPSSLSLAQLAELQHIRRPQCWQVLALLTALIDCLREPQCHM